MEINIVIKTGNLYEEINKNINYILSKINKKINIIFVSYDSKCNQNLVYESYGEYENIKVVKYKNYNYGFIKNFIISLKLCKYITFLDINNIKEINDISKIYTDNEDILILDLENKKEICTDRQIYIYKNKFLLDLDLFFDKNILEFDYLQIIKSIYFASKIKYIKNKNTIEDNTLIGGKIFETFTKIFINNNRQNFKNKSFIIYIYDILNFMDSYNLYNERKYFVNEIKKVILDIPIDLRIQLESPKLYYLNNLKKDNTKNLFIVHTLYHILLAVSLCTSNEYKIFDNHIFINKTFDISDDLIKKLKYIFKKIYIIDLPKDTTYIEELTYINELLENNKYENIFVNNESEVKTQYILTTRLNTDGKIIYVEDGMANYYNIVNRKFGMEIHLANTFSEELNMNIEGIDLLGMYSCIKERYFLYPNLIVDKLKDNKKNNKIEENLLNDSITILYSNKIYEIKNNSILIALEHSSFFDEINEYNLHDYINIIEKISKYATKLNHNIYIKYHPRENNEYLNEFILNKDNMFLLDKNIPMEAFFKDKNIILISLRSTSIITFCKILGPKNAICIQNLINKNKDDLYTAFGKLGVFFPNSVEEIILKIKNNV